MCARFRYELDDTGILYQITPDVISGIDNETLKQYDGIVILLATNKMGGFNYGTMGKWKISKDGEEISLSVSLTYPEILESVSIKVLYHEYGHNLGWYHSAYWVPPKNQECRYCEDLMNIVRGTNSCQMFDYGDSWTNMGYIGAQTDCQRRKDAGWINESQSVTVRSDSTVELDQRELASDGIKLINIPCGYNEEEEIFYFIEYFKAALSYFDSKSKYTSSANSILLRLWTGKALGYYGEKSIIFSEEESVTYFENNDVFCDSARGVKIELLEIYGSGADSKARVKISFDCPEEIVPAVNFSSDETISIFPEETAEYKISISNNCKIGCGTRTYNLAATTP